MLLFYFLFLCLQLSIVTCMDSRLLIDKMLPGVDIGDVEIIRNAGDDAACICVLSSAKAGGSLQCYCQAARPAGQCPTACTATSQLAAACGKQTHLCCIAYHITRLCALQGGA